MKNVCFMGFFCNFAIPKIEEKFAQPANAQIFKGFWDSVFFIKVVQRCYNQKEQNLEGNRKTG